jgi:hypothetical protein
MHRPFSVPIAAIVALAALCMSGGAHALDKVDTYICPTKAQGTGIECFLEAVPQTYTMCRHIKHIEILEFGVDGAQEGVHGAKTEYCIDKHKLSITRPYQAALREAARNPQEVTSLRKLYDTWLDSLAHLVPTPQESTQGYIERVSKPYGEFNEQIAAIKAMNPNGSGTPAAAAKPASKPAAKAKPAKADTTKQ